jgi:hypothetical protein
VICHMLCLCIKELFQKDDSLVDNQSKKEMSKFWKKNH